MSTTYGIDVDIEEVAAERVAAVQGAMEALWSFDQLSYSATTGSVLAYGEDLLSGGDDIDDVKDALVQAIWQANEAYCWIQLTIAYVEQTPTDLYEYDEDRYRAYLEQQHGQTPSHLPD